MYLPCSPGFSPYLWFISLVWRKVVTVEAIASIYLDREKRGKKLKEKDKVKKRNYHLDI